MNVWYINSILGAICLEEENDALCGVHFCPDGAPELEPLPRRVVETPLLQEAEEQLNEYFAGVRREFDLPLSAKGTAFQQTVWAQLRKIPYGEVRTYGQLAAALGNPKASRDVYKRQILCSSRFLYAAKYTMQHLFRPLVYGVPRGRSRHCGQTSTARSRWR